MSENVNSALLYRLKSSHFHPDSRIQDTEPISTGEGCQRIRMHVLKPPEGSRSKCLSRESTVSEWGAESPRMPRHLRAWRTVRDLYPYTLEMRKELRNGTCYRTVGDTEAQGRAQLAPEMTAHLDLPSFMILRRTWIPEAHG